MQRPRLPRDLADLLRPHHDRPDHGHRAAGDLLRGRRLRALDREHVLHPGRDRGPGRGAGELLDLDRQLRRRLLGSVDLGGFAANLVPVTLGNIVGGALLVAAMYWLAYLRPRRGRRRRFPPAGAVRLDAEDQ